MAGGVGHIGGAGVRDRGGVPTVQCVQAVGIAQDEEGEAGPRVGRPLWEAGNLEAHVHFSTKAGSSVPRVGVHVTLGVHVPWCTLRHQ